MNTPNFENMVVACIAEREFTNAFCTCCMSRMFQIKNRVPASLNQEGWENQTITRLQEQISQVP